MKKIKIITKYMAAVAAAAMLFIGCSKDNDNDQPSNPNTPNQPSTPEAGKKVSSQVVYEANPRFFATENCLNALSAQLSRISNLGCDILWIMPICEPSTAPQSVGSPYSIKNYEAINPKYGTISDLQNLVKSAHNLGMKVILDWVPNHTGWDNPWITEHPDWFMQRNGQIISPPGQNWADVAQLNYQNPEVAPAMASAMEYWVKETDIDGFRLDYADSPQIPSSFWTMLADNLKKLKTDIILLAESSNYSFYNYGYDMIYDWNSAPTISSAFRGGKPTSVVEEAEGALGNVPEGKSILRYVFNHDTMSENGIDTYYGSINALPAAYVCASMLNGTPLIYSGMDAKGLTGTQSFFNYKQITFNDELTPVYKAINMAFKQSAEVRGGNLANISTSEVIAFTRKLNNHTLLVVVNPSNKSVTISTPMAIVGLNVTDLINGDTKQVGSTMKFDAYGYTILMN